MRMLITLFSLLFILGTYNTAHALATAEQCNAGTDATACNAIAGCYWNSGTCSQCPGGTYKGTTGTTCTKCPDNVLAESEVGWDTSILGQTSESECHWKSSSCHSRYQYLTSFKKGGTCEYCQEHNTEDKFYYFFNKGTLKGTLGDSEDAHWFGDYCKTCGNNTTSTSNRSEKCTCKHGYVFPDTDGKTPTNNVTAQSSDNCVPSSGYQIKYVCDTDTDKKQNAFTSCPSAPNCSREFAAIYDYFYKQKYNGILCDNDDDSLSLDCDHKEDHKITYGSKVSLRFQNNDHLLKCQVGDDTTAFRATFFECTQGTNNSCVISNRQQECKALTTDVFSLVFEYCKKPGHKLAGWWVYNDYTSDPGNTYDDPNPNPNGQIIYANDASEDFKNKNPDGIDMNALVWKWAPTDKTKKFYAVWEPITITCAPGYYLPANTDKCESCKPGYYCPGVNAFNNKDQGLTPCPAGSTSNAGAIAISECFVKPFVSQFSFGGITFALPANGQAFYSRKN